MFAFSPVRKLFTSIEVKKQNKAKQTSKIQTTKGLNGKHSLYLRISASSSITRFMQTVKVLISNEESVTYQNELLIVHSTIISKLFFFSSFSWARDCVLLRCNATWKTLILCPNVELVLRVRLASPFNSKMSFITNLLSSFSTHIIILVA